MTALAYIYVGDQGRVFASTDEPTDEDLTYAGVGMVTIIGAWPIIISTAAAGPGRRSRLENWARLQWRGR